MLRVEELETQEGEDALHREGSAIHKVTVEQLMNKSRTKSLGGSHKPQSIPTPIKEKGYLTVSFQKPMTLLWMTGVTECAQSTAFYDICQEEGGAHR